MNPLKELHERIGESIWMDNIRRGMLNNGQLEHYIEKFSLTGLTSNPTIFEHAIGGGGDYDEGIRKHLDDARPDAEQIFFELEIEDLQQAADLFRPTFDKSGGRDGYVSLELVPGLADDAEGSIKQARDFAGRAQRPNLFIKVPGTEAGATAIETLIYEGIPVNVTLLFSPGQYKRAAEAYLRGIERRIAEGKDARVPSVASLFISRWDKASADQLPDELDNQLGIAIGMQTYRAYRELFDSPRWKKLADQGAMVQRLLWASTGTKDPSLPDDYYIYNLTAPETINTVPEATLFAVVDNGRVGDPLPADGGDADDTIKAINEAGVDTDKLAQKLQEDGKESFSKSYSKLLAQIEKKLEELREASDEEEERLGKFEAGIRRQIGEIEENNVVERIWAHDYTVWQDEPTEITNRLGWLTSPQEMLEEVPRLDKFVQDLRKDGITHVLWSGMGGSSLFPQVMRASFRDAGGLEMIVLDSSNPVTVRAAAESLPLDKTLFLFASKSGGTLETRCHLDYFWSLNDNPSQYAVITDKGSELGKIGKERGFRQVFFNNPYIGGRYSALSHFGMVAAALLGVDVEELLSRAGQMIAACMPDRPAKDHPGVRLGAAIGYASRQGCDKLTLILPEEIATFGMWLEQLVAESTGKNGIGILPVAGEPVGAAEVYGDDRFFACLGEQTGSGRIDSEAHPLIRLPYVDRYSIGAECFRWEFAIAVAGHVLGINAFNQPNVEAAKKAASKVLEEGVPDLPTATGKEALKAVKPGDYLAIQAYVATDSKHFAALEQARETLRDRLRVATTLGLGPRYLHSTGQLHKGGYANGVFVQIVDDTSPDLDIPGRPYSFAQLFEAQAAGDYLALQDHDRRVFRVGLQDFLDAAEG
ncbi:MAG: bifunctional transaldolase/phosoglucose isomerase [Gammaproteobacteria bacterium]|nr:bifunctional transaldolase/phosoglucose isomerase [Gammaproteobacteria bacterium]